MSMVTAFIKDILESLLRNTRIAIAGKKFIVNNTLSALKKDGIFIVPSFLTVEQCEKYISIIDECIEDKSSNVWLDDEEADHRIYFINEINEDMNAFYKNQYIRNLLTLYTGIINPKGMLLAAKIEYKKNNKGSGGGWHRDSPFNHQFKGICYLNDVHEGEFALADAHGVRDAALEIHLRCDAGKPATPDDGQVGMAVPYGLRDHVAVVHLVSQDA